MKIKKVFFIFICYLGISCSGNTSLNQCFQNDLAPIVLSKNSPQLQGILVPNGSSIISGGIKGILLYNGGPNGIKAFDLCCPNKDCNTRLSFSSPKFTCPCDESQYSVLDGSLVAGESPCSLREYSVSDNGSSIRISN